MAAAVPPNNHARAFSVLKSFASGFVDTVGFVALFGLFTAHVTGNFVLIGASLAHAAPGVIAKLLALPMFILVVAATRAGMLWLEHRRRGVALPVVLLELVLLLAFMLAGACAQPITGADGWAAIGVGMLGVASMAVQNTASRLSFAYLGPTTVMTGNVTQLVIDAVDLGCGGAAPGTRERMRKTWPAVLAFAIGAVGGGLGYKLAGFWALLLPSAALACLTAWLSRSSSTPPVARA